MSVEITREAIVRDASNDKPALKITGNRAFVQIQNARITLRPPVVDPDELIAAIAEVAGIEGIKDVLSLEQQPAPVRPSPMQGETRPVPRDPTVPQR